MVEKGEVRVVTHAFVRPIRATYFVRHVRCVAPPFLASIQKAPGSIDSIPFDSSMDAETVAATKAQLCTPSLSTHSS